MCASTAASPRISSTCSARESLPAGRYATATARASTQAIVVNRAFVNQLLGGANAVGRRVHYVEAGRREAAAGGTVTHYEIVGVVTDLGTNTIAPDVIEPVIYHSLRSSTRRRR